ncbi:MAG: PAS domain S-box protein [Anaerolineales bacterium]|nr:PAS domain S-box protein [Anaerolineales bacterium]
MPIPLRVLIVEDNPDDAELAILHLTQAGFQPDWQRVETEADYLSALESLPELILSDWSLPRFNGLEALRLLTDRNLDIPFVIVSGSIGEESAIDALRKGADDYVLKDRPTRLGESARRALVDKQLRGKRQQAEKALREAEEKYRSIFNGALEGIFQSTPDGRFITANPALARMWGYETPEELVSSITDIASQVYADPQCRDKFARMMEMDGEIHGFEYQARCKDGTLMWASENAHVVRDASGTILHYEGSIEDVTERKRAEEKLSEQLDQLQLLRAIDTAIISSVELDSNLQLIIQKTIEQLHIDAAAILLLDPKTQTLNFATGQGFHSNALQFTCLEIGKGTAGSVAQERKTIHISNLQETNTNPALTQALKDEGFIAYYGIPLIAKDQLLGVLEIFHRASLPTDPDWLSFLETLAGQASISIDNATLFSDLQKSNTELVLAYDATLEGWSYALDLRDNETEGHTLRVTELAVKLSRAMKLSEDEILHIRRGALLHDIGKMGVPDSILLKPGKLTAKEWIVMRKHPTYARDMLSRIEYLRAALDIPYCHHEKWNGMGYPQGLKGEEIPLAARLFTVIDVWDALSSDRPYRKAWKTNKIIEYIKNETGKYFDPRMAKLFLAMVKQGEI